MMRSASYVIHKEYWKNTSHKDSGSKTLSDDLKDCFFEVSLADLQKNGIAFRKLKIINKNVLRKTLPV